LLEAAARLRHGFAGALRAHAQELFGVIDHRAHVPGEPLAVVLQFGPDLVVHASS